MAAGESASVENKMITLFKLRTSPTLYIIQGSGLHTALLVLSTFFLKNIFQVQFFIELDAMRRFTVSMSCVWF